MIFLVRDFDGERIFYVWAKKAPRLTAVSKPMPSLAIAREWYLRYQQQNYAGKERRRRCCERRIIRNRRKDAERAQASDRRQRSGRRCTDHEIRVHIDLAAKKLAELGLNLSLKT
ncbi:hypothetical protein ACFVYJ_04845 [Pontibacter sp. JAM-7]|uniref:hypothetical protein n=1 Tax=Pontibacter sp. JAM-7 TaxID=3366581 RepID=UPI003AF49964